LPSRGFLLPSKERPAVGAEANRVKRRLEEALSAREIELSRAETDEGPAEDLVHLQELLDGFRHHYNNERPHQGIGNLTPVERYRHVAPTIEGPVSTGVDENGEPTYPPHSIVRKVSSIGNIGYKTSSINVGRRFAHARVRVIDAGELTHIYWGEELIRVLKVDPTKERHNLRKEEITLTSVS
jgi:hypothetical protein